MLSSIVRPSTRSFHSSALVSYLPPSRRAKFVQQPHYILADEPPHSALVRVGDKKYGGYLRSMVEAMSLLRDIEHKFGRLREFKFMRVRYLSCFAGLCKTNPAYFKDHEVNTRYQAFLQVIFKDPADLKHVPTDQLTCSFIRPSLDLDRPGGVGLDELESVLQPQELRKETSSSSNFPTFGKRQENAVEEDEQDRLVYTIRRLTEDHLVYPPWGKLAMEPSTAASESFLQWGGFHQIKPVPAQTTLQIEEAFHPSRIDHYRMRIALRRHSEVLGVPNPFETIPAHKSKQIPIALEWEPLPGHSSAPKDTPMPSRLTRNSRQSAPSVSSFSQAASTSPPAISHHAESTVPIPETTPAMPASIPSPVLAHTSPETKAHVPQTVAEVEDVADKMKNQANSMMRRRIKLDGYKKLREEGPPLRDKRLHDKPPSVREWRNQVLKEQLAKDAQREEAPKPKTISEKVTGFFSGIFKGRVLGHKRAKRNTRPNTSLIQIEGVATKEDAQFYLGKRIAFVYKAKREIQGSKVRVIWG
ncbi:hypothetical protein C0991_011307 [Blastosporella zonata]|nr:hypothetical protein C0991_011307 [Blastosporella zonata]